MGNMDMDRLVGMSDERIEELGHRFIKARMGVLLNITFGMYIDNPAYYDALIEALDSGHGLRMSDIGMELIVELNGR